MGRDGTSGGTQRTLAGTPPVASREKTIADEPEPAPLLEVGTRINQYELIRELGRGGMGQVWAARDTRLGRRVAIKFLITNDRDLAGRFLVEARATAQCSHENIVIVHEADEVGGMPYMVLEYLEGQTLRGVISPFGSASQIPAARAIELMLPVARALSVAHQRGIVHRDLKPENVFVTSAGQVKVLDFGIAKALGVSDNLDEAAASEVATVVDSATRDGALVGTLPYMSPEQFGTDTVDHRSDLWAFGIMLFEMLAGRHPVEPLTGPAVIANAVTATPMPSVGLYAPDTPGELVQLVELCLRKDKHARVATAEAIVTRIEPLTAQRRGRQLVEGESPYPGLSAFQETDADRFFGREREVARMVARVRELPLTGIVGPSGVGKSSFVRAGVGPALKASGEAWDIVTLRPGRQPMVALATIVLQLTTQSGITLTGELANHQQLAHRLWTEPGFLGSVLRERVQRVSRRLLLFVDQFEELYTLVADIDERRAFTAALAGVADDAATPLRAVVSMRSDFLDRVHEDPRFMDDLAKGLVFLAPPDRAGLRAALVEPVEMVGHRFESAAMVDDMLAGLAHTPGALPLLQFAAAKLWDARDRDRRLLTEASYRAIGGISGALATHADDVVASLGPRAQKLTQLVFRRLITPERTRAIVELGDLEQLTDDRVELGRVIEQLVAARLLVVQTRSDGGSGTLELVHESLIDRWPTLRRWLDEEQEDAAFVAQLAAAAKQWESKGRPAGLLWRGEAMEEARRWFQARPRELAPRERAYLDAILSLERRGKRRRRIAWTAAFVFLSLATVGASVGVVLVNRAKDEAKANAATEQKALSDFKAAVRQQAEAERQQHDAEEVRNAAVAKANDQEQKNAQLVQARVIDKQESAAELRSKNVALSASLAQITVAKKKTDEERARAEQLARDLKAKNDEQAAELKSLRADALSHKLR